MSTVFKLKRSSVKGKAPTTSNIELGEIAINTNDGRLFFKTTDSASSSAIVTLREISAGTGITQTGGELKITDTGVVSGSYGSSTEIPILSINAQGQIDSATTVSVAGVSGLAYDSDTNLLTLSTADGGSYSVRIDVNTFTDSDTTDDLPEGSTNQYFTNARVQTHLGAVTGSIIPDTDSAYDLGSSDKKFKDLYLSGQSIYLGNIVLNEHNDQLAVHTSTDSAPIARKFDLSNNTTDDLPEGTTNLYYDSAAVVTAARSALTTSGDALSYNPQTGTITFSEVQYNGFDSDFSQKTTSDLTEGSNLYFTTARARGSVTANTSGTGYGDLSYDTGSGLFTYAKVTDANIRGRFSAGAGITYNSGTGQISSSITQYTDADARGAVSATDGGGDGSFSYDSATGIFTYTGPSASEVRAHFSAGTGIGISGSGVISTSITQYTDADARGAISVSDAGGDGSLSYDSGTGILTYTGASASEARAHFSAGGDLSYDSNTGRFSFTERTDAEVRGLVSAVDAGGDGSFSYNSANGQFTYTGPSASETRAHFSGGTGVTITNGSVAIGQSVGTTDDVTFGKVEVDSAQVGCLHLTKQATAPNSLAGLLYYDSDPQKGLSFIPTTNELVEDVTINIGQEHLIYVHNLTGAQINNGDVVYISGTAHGAHPQVSLARANSSSTARPVGVATMDIPNGNHGYVTQFGLVRGLNTAGFTQGAQAYLSADSAGKWSTDQVTIDDGYPTLIGTVIATDSSEGTLLVNLGVEHADNIRVESRIRVDGKVEADSGDFKLLNLNTTQYTDVDVPNNLPAFREGNLFYFQGPDALTYSNASMNVKLGQDEIVRVYNNSGSTIAKGKAVYVTGAQNDFPTIALAKADNFNTVYNTLGLTSHSIDNGAFGFVTIRGLFGGLNTAGYTVGDRVHISPDSAGELVDFSPNYPNYAYEVGTVLIADSAGGGNVGGCIQVQLRAETFESTRVQGDGRYDGNLTVAGNLTILGSEQTTTVQSLNVGDQFIYVGAGDTIETVFGSGLSGLNDATFKEYYEGDSDRTYFVKITNTDSSGDTIQWGFDSADGIGEFTPLSFDSEGGTGPTSWNLGVDRTLIPLRYNVKVTFDAATGHTVGNYWSGDASPINLDFGLVGNYNKPDQPYTHAGIFRDTTDDRWKFFNKYDPEVGGNVNTSHSSFEYSDVQANRFHGALTGDVTGNADTATLLTNSRNFSITGNVTASAQSFDGGSNVTLDTTIANNVITNAMVKSDAAIADTKLATISTAGKVQNSATTATSSNTASTIVARDGSGNFTAGTITANLSGNVTGTVSSLSNHTSTIRGLFSVDNTLSYDSSTGQFSITNPGTDSATTHAIFSVDSSANTGDGSLTYNGAGVFTYKGPTAAETRAHFSEGTGISISNGQISTTITQYEDADARSALSGGNTGTGFGSLAYNSGSGAFTFTKVTKANIRSALQAGTGITLDSANGTIATTITQYTDADAQGAISHTNTGTGFGSIGYNSGTGVINYNKVTSANIRSVLSAGGDLSYDSSSGQFSFTETYSTAAELLTALKTVDTNSSGLNADTLDGQQGSHYRLNVYNAAGTLLN